MIVKTLEEQLEEIRGETTFVNRRPRVRQGGAALRRSGKQRRVTEGDLSSDRGRVRVSDQNSEVTRSSTPASSLRRASGLTEEMKRLRRNQDQIRVQNNLVGGIPVDSEYVIFVIDTSGSMHNYSWPLLLQKMNEVLDAYPKVKGIQVMNDMGNFMFEQYRGRWIPDTPARRQAILTTLRTWSAFSNSSPVEGMTKAIQTFYAPDKRISIYVFGDEFTGRSIDAVVRTVELINQADASGRRRVRIHGIGFPYVFTQPDRMQSTGVRFATLMRALCFENDGTFVGLNDFRR